MSMNLAKLIELTDCRRPPTEPFELKVHLCRPPLRYDADLVKYVRIAVTAMSLTACVLLVALWVRSLGAEDRLTGHFLGSNRFRIYSSHGCLVYYVPDTPGQPNSYAWQADFGSKFWLQVSDARIASVPQVHLHSQERWITLPYWLLVGLSAVLAAAPWLRWRFSLRTLLIATTLVAVGLGAIVALR